MAPRTEEAFVLKKKNLPTRDFIVTFFTKEHGKVSAIAKGIKSITSRRAGAIQTGNLVRVVVSSKGDRRYLQEATLVSAFSNLKKEERKLSATYLCFFILDRLLPEGEPEYALYQAAKKYLVGLSREKELDHARLEDFLNQVLRTLGYIDQSQDLAQLKRVVEEVIGQKVPYFVI